mgnify:CR=1 FL=1
MHGAGLRYFRYKWANWRLIARDECTITAMNRRGFYFGLTLSALLSGCAAHEHIDPSRPPHDALTPWVELTIRPSLARRVTETTLHVGNMPYGAVGEPSEQWLRKTMTFFGGGSVVQWTDTRTCAAAPAVLTNMYALEMPRPTEGGTFEVRADGVTYTLRTDAEFRNGRLATLFISAPSGTPLADWAEQSLLELETCWSELPLADLSYR